MHYRSFREYVLRRDETLWLPNQPVVASIAKINPFPVSQGRLDRLRPKPVKAPQQVKPASPKLIPSPTSQYLKAINRAFE